MNCMIFLFRSRLSSRLQRKVHWLVYRSDRLFLLAIPLLFIDILAAEIISERYVAYFPQVVRGKLVNQFETLIIVSNPNTEPVDVTLTPDLSVGAPLFSRTTMKLEPGETRTLEVSGDDFRAGWVRLEATKLVSATAHILARPSSSSTQVISQVTVQAQEAVSKVVIPVFLRGVGPEGKVVADNTGVALATLQVGGFRFTLREPAGNVVATRTLRASCSLFAGRDFCRHLARFVTDLFPDIPQTFTQGSLTIEHADPAGVPRAFAATALYTRDEQLWSAEVTPIDVPGTYLIKFRPTDNLQQKAQEIAQQYGFVIKEFFLGAPDTAIATALDKVAEAVARDPRVAFVEPNATVEVAGQ